MRTVSRLAAALGALLLAATQASCGVLDWISDGPPRFGTACGIAIDGSGSSDAKRGFDAKTQAEQTVEKFLRTNECRKVVFAAIAAASEGSVCHRPALDLDPDLSGNTDRDALRASKRAAAVKTTTDVLQCIRTDPRSNASKSDVLGGLKILASRKPLEGDYKILVISDFVENGPDGNLNRLRAQLADPAARTALIDQMATHGRVPALPDTDVATAGYGALYSDDSTAFAGFDAFWRELLLNRAGCTALHEFGSVA